MTRIQKEVAAFRAEQAKGRTDADAAIDGAIDRLPRSIVGDETLPAIKKAVAELGWSKAQVDAKCCTGGWPEPHFRVTVWNLSMPMQYGHEWAMGDGSTRVRAWKALLENIKAGRYNLNATYPKGARR